MIKIAVPNKGGLFEPTMALLRACGYHIKKSQKALTCIDQANGVEFFFIRAGDIPMYYLKVLLILVLPVLIF